MLHLKISIVIVIFERLLLPLLHCPIGCAAHAYCQAHHVDDYCDGERLDFGVGVVGEVPDDPVVFIRDQSDERPVEEEAHNQNARAIVPAAFHDRVHFSLLSIS